MVDISTNSEGAELFHSRCHCQKRGRWIHVMGIKCRDADDHTGYRHVYAHQVCQIHLGPLP